MFSPSRNTPAVLIASAAPPARRCSGVAGYWTSSNAAVQVVMASPTSAAAYTTGVGSADALHVQATCANIT